MSRVFEALEKASKESHAAVVKSADEPVAVAERSPQREAFRPNGENGSLAGHGRSWREKAEEFLFGGDLRNYESFPIVALEQGSPAAEQYKILREQVRKLRGPAGTRIISVTSPIKRDGKSTVSANLAAALALEYGEQVLLIDCDLRNPQMHQYFGLSRNPGLTDYLTSSSTGNLLNYVQQSSLPGLQLLAAGKSAGLSSELLAMDKMHTIFTEIREKFPNHQIIVDSPPVLSTPEPLILSAQVDGIIMVIRASKTPRDCLVEAIESLKTDKLLGIVLNGAELGITSKYYYY